MGTHLEKMIHDVLSLAAQVASAQITQAYPAPPPKSRAVRKRDKVLQTLEKASAKSEVILIRLMECGKLQPGSLERVTLNYIMPASPMILP